MKNIYILKRATSWIFININEIVRFSFYPKHKERDWESYKRDNMFPDFSTLRGDYDVEKDPWAREVEESWEIKLKSQEFPIRLTKEEYEKIKEWIETLENEE